MKVSNDDTFTGKFNLCGITITDFSRKVPVKLYCCNCSIFRAGFGPKRHENISPHIRTYAMHDVHFSRRF